MITAFVISFIKLSIKCMKLVGYMIYYSILAIMNFYLVFVKVIFELSKKHKIERGI